MGEEERDWINRGGSNGMEVKIKHGKINQRK